MVNWFPFQYVGLSRTNNKYRAVRTAAQNYAAALNAMNKAGPNQNALRAAKENHDKKKLALNAAILAYMRPTSGGVPPTGAPPAAGNVPGRMQLPRNGKINGAVVSNSLAKNFSPGNVYKVGSNFYAASKTRNRENIWVPARRADRLNPFSKRFIKLMVTTPYNKVVNANGKVTFVPRNASAGPGPDKAELIPNARLNGANGVYKFKNLFYARAVASAEGRPINGRRPKVFYRVNRAANGSFAFSTNANVKNLKYVMANGEFRPEPTYDVAQRGKFNAFVKQQLARTNLTGNNKAKGAAILSAWQANKNLSTLSKSNNYANRPANWSNKALHNYMWAINQANRNNIEANANRTGATERGVWPPLPARTAGGAGGGAPVKNLATFVNWYGKYAAGLKNNNNRAQTYLTVLTGPNAAKLGGITKNNNGNAVRAPFWAAVQREMNRRAAGGK